MKKGSQFVLKCKKAWKNIKSKADILVMLSAYVVTIIWIVYEIYN